MRYLQVRIFPARESCFRSWNTGYGAGKLAASTAQHIHTIEHPKSSRSLIPWMGSVWHWSQQPTPRSRNAPQVTISPSSGIRRAEMLKELGVKPLKALPTELVDAALEVTSLPVTLEDEGESGKPLDV